MFVVMKLQDFEFTQNYVPLPIKIDVGNMVGYLPVYGSVDEALADFPGAKLMAVREVDEVQQN